MVVVYLLVCNKNVISFSLHISLTFNRFVCLNRGSVSEFYLLPANIRTALFVSLVFV